MRRLALAVTVCLLAGCTTGPGIESEPAEVGTSPSADLAADHPAGSVDEVICGPFNRRVEPSDDLLEGRISLSHFEPVQVDEIDWSMDPHDHPSWRFGLHSLDFVWPSIAAAREGGREGHVTRALEVVEDWVAQNPFDNPPSDFSWNDHSTAKRTHLMACLQVISPRDWLADAIEHHAEVLGREDFYTPHTNHGISQDIALLIAGCAIGSDDITGYAEERAAKAAAAKVDHQGVLDEQAPGYQGYVLRQYQWYAEIAETCGRDREGIIPDLDAMAEALAHMRMPDGRLVPIGDTYWVEDPPGDPRGLPDGPTIRTFDTGYVLGRSEGGPDATFYAIRFGPGRYIHGHDDKTSLFLYALGAPRLVEGAHVGYEQTPFRRYLQGPMAHNVTVVEGGEFDRTAETELVERDVSDAEQAFVLRDSPYDGVVRERSVDVSLEEMELVVHDHLEADESRDFLQLWHLPPESQVTVEGQDVIAEFADGVTMRITQVLPVDSIEIVEGQEDPYLGWFAPGHRLRSPSPVVVSRLSGRSVEYRTVIGFD